MKRRKKSTKPQVLAPLTLTRCIKCGKLVQWNVEGRYKCVDGKHVVRYLSCSTPGCDGRARQLVDVAQ